VPDIARGILKNTLNKKKDFEFFIANDTPRVTTNFGFPKKFSQFGPAV